MQLMQNINPHLIPPPLPPIPKCTIRNRNCPLHHMLSAQKLLSLCQPIPLFQGRKRSGRPKTLFSPLPFLLFCTLKQEHTKAHFFRSSKLHTRPKEIKNLQVTKFISESSHFLKEGGLYWVQRDTCKKTLTSIICSLSMPGIVQIFNKRTCAHPKSFLLHQ